MPKGRDCLSRSTLRWILAALLVLSLLFTLSAPFIADAEGSALPLDFTEGGKLPKDEGWTFEGKRPVSYEDSTIRVTFEKTVFSHKLSAGSRKGKTVRDEAWIVRVKIRDVSQFRTAVSRDSYKGRERSDAVEIANSKNAVVAMNGDFFKYEWDVGYIVRQGELIRDATGNARGRVFDMLLVDSEGDFHPVYSAKTKSIGAFVDEYLTPFGLTVLDTFNLGPVLVVNGEAQDVSKSEAARQGMYYWRKPEQRIAIAQTGHLEYAIVMIGTKPEVTGLTMQEFADFVAQQCPDALLAYNMDGGGSLSLISRKSAKSPKLEMICRYSGHRNITDILYFASAED